METNLEEEREEGGEKSEERWKKKEIILDASVRAV